MPYQSVTVYPLAGTASSAVARARHPIRISALSVYITDRRPLAARVPIGDHFDDTVEDETDPKADCLGEMACRPPQAS